MEKKAAEAVKKEKPERETTEPTLDEAQGTFRSLVSRLLFVSHSPRCRSLGRLRQTSSTSTLFHSMYTLFTDFVSEQR